MTDLAYNQGFLNTRKMSIIEAMRKNKQKQFLVNEQNSQWEKWRMGLKDAAELEQLKNTHKKPTPKHPTNQNKQPTHFNLKIHH